MKHIENISSNKNYTAINVGSIEFLRNELIRCLGLTVYQFLALFFFADF